MSQAPNDLAGLIVNGNDSEALKLVKGPNVSPMQRVKREKLSQGLRDFYLPEGDPTLIEIATVQTPQTSVALASLGQVSPLLQTVPTKKSEGVPLLAMGIVQGLNDFSAALVREAPMSELPSPGDLAIYQRSWFELAMDYSAYGVIEAFSMRRLDPLEHLSDGDTVFERVFYGVKDDSLRERVVNRFVVDGGLSVLTNLSNGQTVFECLLSAQAKMFSKNPLITLIETKKITGIERLGDGTTLFEVALRADINVALALVSTGDVNPHGYASTGQSFFEAALEAGAFDVAAKFAGDKTFDSLERTFDGKTLLELCLERKAINVALACFSGDRVPQSTLLSDGKTPFEHMLILGSKELIFGAIAGQSLTPITKLPPNETTPYELAVKHGAQEIVMIFTKFCGLNGLYVLASGKTCFEYAIDMKQEAIAIGFVEGNSVGPKSTLPSGKTCLDYAVNAGAKGVCQALIQKI